MFYSINSPCLRALTIISLMPLGFTNGTISAPLKEAPLKEAPQEQAPLSQISSAKKREIRKIFRNPEKLKERINQKFIEARKKEENKLIKHYTNDVYKSMNFDLSDLNNEVIIGILEKDTWKANILEEVAKHAHTEIEKKFKAEFEEWEKNVSVEAEKECKNNKAKGIGSFLWGFYQSADQSNVEYYINKKKYDKLSVLGKACACIAKPIDVMANIAVGAASSIVAGVMYAGASLLNLCGWKINTSTILERTLIKPKDRLVNKVINNPTTSITIGLGTIVAGACVALAVLAPTVAAPIISYLLPMASSMILATASSGSVASMLAISGIIFGGGVGTGIIADVMGIKNHKRKLCMIVALAIIGYGLYWNQTKDANFKKDLERLGIFFTIISPAISGTSAYMGMYNAGYTMAKVWLVTIAAFVVVGFVAGYTLKYLYPKKLSKRYLRRAEKKLFKSIGKIAFYIAAIFIIVFIPYYVIFGEEDEVDAIMNYIKRKMNINETPQPIVQNE